MTVRDNLPHSGTRNAVQYRPRSIESRHMSQYPNPQTPVPIGYFPDPLALAKRAGILMIVLGVLTMLCGVGTAFISQNWEAILAQQPAEVRSSIPAEVNSHALLSEAKLISGIALGLMALGVVVRRGRKGPCIAAIGLVGLIAVFFALIVVASLTQIGRGNPMGIGAVLIFGSADLVVIWLLIWLIQALNSTSQIAQTQSAYQAQYWQHLQQQQAYQNIGAPADPYSQNAYNAPAAPPAAQGGNQTGWQMPLPPPPPEAASTHADPGQRGSNG